MPSDGETPGFTGKLLLTLCSSEPSEGPALLSVHRRVSGDGQLPSFPQVRLRAALQCLHLASPRVLTLPATQMNVFACWEGRRSEARCLLGTSVGRGFSAASADTLRTVWSLWCGRGGVWWPLGPRCRRQRFPSPVSLHLPGGVLQRVSLFPDPTPGRAQSRLLLADSPLSTLAFVKVDKLTKCVPSVPS